MSGNTQQWLRDELRQLVSQQNRYSIASAAATDARVKERHERNVDRLQDEILGIEEAIDALDRQHDVRDDGQGPLAPADVDERVTDRHRAVTVRPHAAVVTAPPPGPALAAAAPVVEPPDELTPDTILLRRRIMGQVAKVVTSAFVVGFFVVAVSMALGGEEASAAASASSSSQAATSAKTDPSAAGVLASGRR